MLGRLHACAWSVIDLQKVLALRMAAAQELNIHRVSGKSWWRFFHTMQCLLELASRLDDMRSLANGLPAGVSTDSYNMCTYSPGVH
jgi:hypothetical protein